ncbi:PREDICTED: uncharacterized protein LOC107074302 [Polistes dominula]|uniref:Uncharacterized protein LOC107074302 n=1 Tax=Polistes dominula TaxID=743375 RepID=A0ABM1JF68_POLDO|nr:PREDICTED: uncharacterized protein LOC107074302 [Polistes dominula]XP_015191106.1 PREDICTED: uncharacterized protein LOC107074302 [Polistes dominula]
MASDKSGNKKPALPENVQIKIEPGTSLPINLNNIKTEPGVAPTTTRLTSFRLPRDLTLGGNIKTEKTKKIYVPNLNTQRNRKKEETAVTKNDSDKSVKQRGRGRGRGSSDRGRGRGNSNLIQTSGVFSQGTNDEIRRRARGEGGGRYSSDRQPILEKPVLNLNRVINKEEEQQLKEFEDDDIDEDTNDDDTDDLGQYNAPISLPIIKKNNRFKTEPKTEIKTEPKTEPKTETSTLDDEEEIDQKPIILENGTVMKVKKEIKKDKYVKSEPIESLNLWDNISQIAENPAHSYMLMQFPECLPGLEASNDNYEPKSKIANDNTTQEKENQNNSKKNFTLSSLKAGMIGTLQILKSGNARLCLGKSNLHVNVGSTQSFRQDLIAAKLNTVELDGELINLGKVTNTLICSPEWNSMFLNSTSAFDNLSSV